MGFLSTNKMSKPATLNQQSNPTQTPKPQSAPSLHSLQNSEDRLVRTVGSVGSFMAGGALLDTRQVVSLAIADSTFTLTPDQIVGSDIFLSSAAGGTLTLPSGADIVKYLSASQCQPSQAYADNVIVNVGNVAAPPALPTPGVYLPSFEFSISMINGSTASLDSGAGSTLKLGGLGSATTAATYALVAGGGAGLAKVNRFRAYVLDSDLASATVAIVALDQ